MQISQWEETASPSIPTGRSQTVEKAETRFRAIDEIWELFEELVKLWLLDSASLIVVSAVGYPTIVFFGECVGVYDVKSSDTQKFG